MSGRGAGQSLNTSNLADLLERVLDKGVVIAGDIKVKLVDIELLTIQIRLVICSVDKAKEMGMDWWANQPIIESGKAAKETEGTIAALTQRLNVLEAELAAARALPAAPMVPAPEPLRPWTPPQGTVPG
jgi:hypothetical protein